MSINASRDRQLQRVVDKATKDIIKGFKRINNTWYSDFSNAFKNLDRGYSNKNNPLDFWYYYEDKIADVIPDLIPTKLKRLGITLQPEDLVSDNYTQVLIDYNESFVTINFNAYMGLVRIRDLADELGYSYDPYFGENVTEEERIFRRVDEKFEKWQDWQISVWHNRGWSDFFRKIKPKLSMIEKEIEEKYQDYFRVHLAENRETDWKNISFYFDLLLKNK